MFLFHKRTKNVIKYVWGVFAVLIILSMVLAYSGFVRIASTSTPTQTQETGNSAITLTKEDLEALRAQQQASVTASQVGVTSEQATPERTTLDRTEKTPPEQLDFSL